MQLINNKHSIKPEALTAQTFREKVYDYISGLQWNYKGSLPCVIDFWAAWCGPCKMLAPIIDELAQEYAGKVLFYKVDTDAQQELAQVFGIRSIPTLLFVPIGDKPKMAAGALPKHTLREIIEKDLIPTIPPEQDPNRLSDEISIEQESLGEDEITVEQLRTLLANKNDNVLLLDVRFPDEHAQRHIEYSQQLLIPLPELESRLHELEPYRNHLIITYCRSGARSGTATNLLRSSGFNVRNLRGGILAWTP